MRVCFVTRPLAGRRHIGDERQESPPSACLSISLSDEHQMVYSVAQMRQPCAPKLNPVLVITNTGFSDH